jgi:nucleotide-binding universal stress UspA family protein
MAGLLHHDNEMAIRKIVVAHDFSEAARRAFDIALDLASRLDASVTVVHTYELSLPPVPFGVDPIPELDERAARVGKEALDAVVDGAKIDGFPAIEGVIRQGVPWVEIDRLAEEIHAGLIVMGTHGHRGISRALLGSSAEKVVRTAPCPVLTVRARDHAA